VDNTPPQIQKFTKFEKICKKLPMDGTPPERPSLWACPVPYGAGLSKDDKEGYNCCYYDTA
jgi:hypothetical protein